MDSDARKVGASTKQAGNRGLGRKKGVPNKLTTTIKQAIEVSFGKVGGPAYLARMAEEQPVAYMGLLGKILPTQIDANLNTIGMPAIEIRRADG